MKRISLLAFTILASVALAHVALAHRDRILSVRPDGVIPELPIAYEATRLRIAFSEGDAGALQQLDFLSSGRETGVQPCLLRLVPKSSFRQLKVTGSWYHRGSFQYLGVLQSNPHYVSVGFLDTPSQQGSPADAGIHFAFSLRDASLLNVAQVIRESATSFHDRHIRLSDGCPVGDPGAVR
jgi:hypothetical protein